MKDKVLFWLGADFTHFCIAYGLHKQYDCQIYAIVDITNKPKKFFQEQKLVNFEKIWFFHDHIKNNKVPDIEYLAAFEKKYKIDLWKLAINERIFYRFFNFHKFTDDEILSILEHECRLFEKILNDVKPDFFVTKETAFHHLHLFYEMCRSQGIKVLMLTIPKVGYKCIISEEPAKFDHVSELPKKIKNRNFDELRSYLKSFNISKQITDNIVKAKGSKIDLLKAAFSFFNSDNRNVRTNYNYYGRTKFKVFGYMLNSFLRRKLREFFINKNLIKEIKNVQCVYFPLAVDMERHLLLGSPFFTNQIEIIRHIAKSIPPGYILYVKESPGQSTRDWRQISEYKEIMAIPNVRLVHPSVDPQRLLQTCSLVITIAGSSGMEAAFHEKPSIVFSDVGYQLLPSVTRIRNIEELPAVIRQSLEKKVKVEDVDAYLTLLEDNSFDFDWFDFSAKFKEKFYFRGNLVDAEIQIDKMNDFLKQHNVIINKIATEHVKKILFFKNLPR